MKGGSFFQWFIFFDITVSKMLQSFLTDLDKLNLVNIGRKVWGSIPPPDLELQETVWIVIDMFVWMDQDDQKVVEFY